MRSPQRTWVGPGLLILGSVVGIAMVTTDVVREPADRAGESPSSIPRTISHLSEKGGPLALYTVREGTALAVRVVDVAERHPRPRTLEVPEEIRWYAFRGSPSVLLLPWDPGRLALLGRGLGGLIRGVIDVDGEVVAAAVSPDGENVAVAAWRGNGSSERVVIAIHPLGGGDSTYLTDFRTASDPSGGALHMFWSGERSLTLIDVCHCDGGPGYSTTYRLALSGRLQKMDFMGDRGSWHVGVQPDAARFVFDDVPNIDCFEVEGACDNLLHRLTIADVSNRSLETIVTRRRVPFLQPLLSPSGSIVAAAKMGEGNIEFYDVRRGILKASAYHEASQFTPMAWLDERRLLALATSRNLVEEVETGQLLLVTLESGGRGVEVKSLARGVDLSFVGWLG